MESMARERFGFGSKWIRDKDDDNPMGFISPREEGLRLLNQMKALLEDNQILLERLSIQCGRWVLVATYGDEPYSVSEATRLKSQLKALNVDLKSLRELPPPPKPQPKLMDGGKLLLKMKGMRADLPDDFKLVVESHPWLAAKVAGTDAFSDEEVNILLPTLDEMAVDVKGLRELKPDMDGAKMLNKMRGLDAHNADTFDLLKGTHPWVAERVNGTDPLTEDEVSTLLSALADMGVDLKNVREVKKPRGRPPAGHVPLPPHKTRLVHTQRALKEGPFRMNKDILPSVEEPLPTVKEPLPVADKAEAPKGTTSGKKSRWANAKEANDRITLPVRKEPVTVPDAADGGTSAQIFRQMAAFANGKSRIKGSSVTFGKIVRRISTTSVPDLAADMMQYGAFEGLNTYKAGEELEERLSGLGNWENIELAALLTSLNADPMDMLRLFTKDSNNPSDS